MVAFDMYSLLWMPIHRLLHISQLSQCQSHIVLLRLKFLDAGHPIKKLKMDNP